MENVIKLKRIGKWNALIAFEDDNFVISYNGKGGAIVSDKLLNNAENKFIKAMELANNIKKFMIR
jgi:hypothetical protein